MSATFTESLARVVQQDSGFAIVREQEITADFLRELHDERAASRSMRAGEHERVASVPTGLIDSWIAQGIPFWDLSARQIVRQLERDNLGAFITTDRAV